MLLYIIRHGETQWNVEGRLQGQSETHLNDNGIRLAKVTAEGLRDVPFDFGITSPLERARMTAQIILGDRNVPLYEDKRIQELSFGSWEGLGCRKENYQIPSEHFEDFYKNPMQFRPAEDGETISQLCERTREFYQELIRREEYQEKTILIASHGCATRAILQNVYTDHSDFWHGSVPLNCAVNIVEVRDGKSRLLEEDKVYYGKEDCVNFYGADK